MGYKCPVCGHEGPRPSFKRCIPMNLVRCPECFEGFDPSEKIDPHPTVDQYRNGIVQSPSPTLTEGEQ